jgi:hypothetical protein
MLHLWKIKHITDASSASVDQKKPYVKHKDIRERKRASLLSYKKHLRHSLIALSLSLYLPNPIILTKV